MSLLVSLPHPRLFAETKAWILRSRLEYFGVDALEGVRDL